MDPPSKLQFPLRNILLMMVPIALMCFAIKMRLDDEIGSAIFFLILGIPAAIGALFGGVRGMRRAFAFTFFGMFFGVLLLTALLVLIAGIVMLISLVVGHS